MSRQYFLAERGGATYALPADFVTGVERFTSSLVRLDLAVGQSVQVERVSMPIEAHADSARRLSPGAERVLRGSMGALRLPQGLVLIVEPAFFQAPPAAPYAARADSLAEISGGATGANGDAMLLRLSGTPARLLLPAAQVLEVIPHPEVMKLEPSSNGLAGLLEWQGFVVPVYGFTPGDAGPPQRIAIVRGTASPEACAIVIDERVERLRWPLQGVHGSPASFTSPLPVRGAFGYEGQPLLIPDVDVLAA